MAADFDNRPTDSRKRARQRTAIVSDMARSALFGTATVWRENNATGEKDARVVPTLMRLEGPRERNAAVQCNENQHNPIHVCHCTPLAARRCSVALLYA